MRIGFVIAALALSACAGPSVEAQDSAPAPAKVSEAQTKIAQRDLREFKTMLPGVYTNEEQVYFQDNLELPKERHLPRLRLTITPDGDGFKAETFNPKTGRKTEARLDYRVEDGVIKSTETRNGQADCKRVFTRNFDQYRGEGCGGAVTASPTGFIFGDPAKPFHMRRARPFKCWVSPRKDDGEYGFYNNIALHDQGGRAWVEGDDHPRVGLKMRNVVWPTGVNRHSFVLYAYRGDDEDEAVSYVWTDPDSKRIALNLRWMQASCTLGDVEITPNINLKTGSGSGK